MNWTWITPIGVVAGLTLLAFGLGQLASYLRTKARYAALAVYVDAASRVAGRVRDAMLLQPAGVNLVATRAALIAAGVAGLQQEFAQTAAQIGATDDKASAIVQGELGKLPIPPAIAAQLAAPAA